MMMFGNGNGQNWTEMILEQSRETTTVAILYYEEENAPLMIDGKGLWTLRDSRWYQPNYPLTPKGRWASSLAYDNQHQQVIMFGGYVDEDIFDENLDVRWFRLGKTDY